MEYYYNYRTKQYEDTPVLDWGDLVPRGIAHNLYLAYVANGVLPTEAAIKVLRRVTGTSAVTDTEE